MGFIRRYGLIIGITVLILLGVLVAIYNLSPSDASKKEYWSPTIGDSFQWQLTDYPIDTSVSADIYDIDLFETSTETIGELHDQGIKVICYINVGAVEEYREDFEDFPMSAIGNEYDGWEGENWLDISRYSLFASVIEARFDLAKEKGCDGIEPDNIEGYEEDTGFDLTYDDQLEYNKWLANQAHSRGMSIGLKNDPEQVDDLLEYFDWALLEDCDVWGFCGGFEPFIEDGKAVFQVEYTDEDQTIETFCPDSLNREFSGILKHRDLDPWMEECIETLE